MNNRQTEEELKQRGRERKKERKTRILLLGRKNTQTHRERNR
jgi:hypothetical protein